MSERELTHEERLAEQTKGNLLTSLAMSMGYLKQNGEVIENYAKYCAEKIKPSWGDSMTIEQFRDNASLNWESFGSKIVSKENNETEATLTYSDYMPKNLSEMFNLTTGDIDIMNTFFVHMAEKFGLKYEWKRDGENTTVKVSK